MSHLKQRDGLNVVAVAVVLLRPALEAEESLEEAGLGEETNSSASFPLVWILHRCGAD